MGRIEQAFSLAERYVRAYECYVEETVRRYHEMKLTEQRNATSSERMTESMSDKIAGDRDLLPRLSELAAHIKLLAEQVGHMNWGSAIEAAAAAQPSSVSDPEKP